MLLFTFYAPNPTASDGFVPISDVLIHVFTFQFQAVLTLLISNATIPLSVITVVIIPIITTVIAIIITTIVITAIFWKCHTTYR